MAEILLLLKNYPGENIFMLEMLPLYIEGWRGEGNKTSLKSFGGVYHLIKCLFLGKIGKTVKYNLS